VVPNNFEFFCLEFILIEDCVATLNTPLHTGGKRPIKKTRSVTTKNVVVSTGCCIVLKKRTVETSREKHPVPERIKLVHNVIMSHAMHHEIDKARFSQLVV
jgi:hypothetical protein